jgi:AmmeMemoRadiSam system protein A
MKDLSDTTKEFLLTLARNAIVSKMHSKLLQIGTIPNEATEFSGTFVTLTKNGELRGCIGVIEPVQSIYKGIIENARSAAFGDPRFPPLRADEIEDVRIEVSILSVPEKLFIDDASELLNVLKKNRPGLIIERGFARATFLPQVWDELRRPEDFLTQLCLKAGIPSDTWKQPSRLEIFTYKVEHVKEED